MYQEGKLGVTRSSTVGWLIDCDAISTPSVVHVIGFRSEETLCLWFIEKDKN